MTKDEARDLAVGKTVYHNDRLCVIHQRMDVKGFLLISNIGKNENKKIHYKELTWQ